MNCLNYGMNDDLYASFVYILVNVTETAVSCYSLFVSLVQYVPRTLFVYIICVYTPLMKNSNADEASVFK